MTEKKTKTPPPKPPEPDAEPEAMPAAGPHAHPRLTNPDSTPGAGVMPDIGPAKNTGGDVDGGAG